MLPKKRKRSRQSALAIEDALKNLSLSEYGFVSADGSWGRVEVWVHVRITVHLRQYSKSLR
jgi:hypothetical protein